MTKTHKHLVNDQELSLIDEQNPAGRLHKLLQKAKGHPDESKIIDVWANTVGCENTPITVTKSVIALYALSQEIQNLIKMRTDLKHEIYLASFENLERAFFPLVLHVQWKSSRHYLNEEALTRLQFCAVELEKFYSEESLSEEDLKDIIEKTDALYESVYKSSMQDFLRLVLLEEIERIRHSISMYKIRGAKGLKEALQSTLGAIITNQEELVNTGKTDTDVIQRLGVLIDKLDSFTSRAMKLQKLLTKPVRFLLEKITNPTDEV